MGERELIVKLFTETVFVESRIHVKWKLWTNCGGNCCKFGFLFFLKLIYPYLFRLNNIYLNNIIKSMNCELNFFFL